MLSAGFNDAVIVEVDGRVELAYRYSAACIFLGAGASMIIEHYPSYISDEGERVKYKFGKVVFMFSANTYIKE